MRSQARKLRTAESAPQPDAPEVSEQQRLRQFSPGGPLTPNVEQPSWPAPRNPLDSSAPATDALLASPPPGDWLTWRRTLDDQGFSPLDSIDKKNVGRLKLEWSHSQHCHARRESPQRIALARTLDREAPGAAPAVARSEVA